MADKDISALLSKQYPAGTVIFEENEPGSRMYIIRSGRVKIFRRVGDQEVVLALLGAGEFLGEMAILENLPRSASAQVVEDALLLEIEADTFDKMIRSNAEIAVRIMRRLASRVRDLDLRVQRLMVDSGLGRTVELLRWLLPKGRTDGEFVRLAAATVHLNLAAQPGLTPAQVEEILASLERAGCIRYDGAEMLVANDRVLEEFSTYLDMKHKYEAPVEDDDPAVRRQGALNAMERLLEALQISPDELEESQSRLARQYKRYMEFKQRFRAFEQAEREKAARALSGLR